MRLASDWPEADGVRNPTGCVPHMCDHDSTVTCLQGLSWPLTSLSCTCGVRGPQGQRMLVNEGPAGEEAERPKRPSCEARETPLRNSVLLQSSRLRPFWSKD
eukprot:6196974-Pleurochrysis_carterae.AAC.3